MKTSKKRKRYDKDSSLNTLEGAVRHFDDVVTPVVMAANKQLGQLPSCTACTKPGCCSQVVLATLIEGVVIARCIFGTARDAPEFRRRLAEVGAEQERLGRDGWWRKYWN